jgi:outer membrane lipoprotein-sorting protein
MRQFTLKEEHAMTRSSRFHLHRNAFLPRGAATAAACVVLTILAGCQKTELPKSKDKTDAATQASSAGAQQQPLTHARDVLARMVAAYRDATSYSDVGAAHITIEVGGQTTQDEVVPFSLHYVRPNKVHVRACAAELVCDGQKTYAYVRYVPGQVFVRAAPPRLTMQSLHPDLVLNGALGGGLAGELPQIGLLFGDDSLETLMKSAEQLQLLAPGQIDGCDCYHVKFNSSDGMTTFWVDQKSFALRRLVHVRQEIGPNMPASKVSVVADFTGAKLNSQIDPHAFRFEMPKDAKAVDFLTPPHMAQLLNKKTPAFKFFDLSGKPITAEALAGRTVVLHFWSLHYGRWQELLKELEQAYQKHKDNPKVAFYAVCLTPQPPKSTEIERAVAELKLHVPVCRPDEASPLAFVMGEPATTFLMNDKGVVQYCEDGFRPEYAAWLGRLLERLLTGEEIFAEPLRRYQEQLDQLRQFAGQPEPPTAGPGGGGETIVRTEPLAAPQVAPLSKPAVLELSPLWKCTEVRSPGNIAVAAGKDGRQRLLVVENWNSVAELGLDGKLIARHDLKLADKEFVGFLRVAAGSDGKQFVAAFLTSQQRCHVLDENWNVVAHFPDDALKNPHGGISDVQLGDLVGDGNLKLYVGYWGVVGVQAASLDGARLWQNRTAVASVSSLAIGGPDANRHRQLFCINESGAIVVLDAQGTGGKPMAVRNRKLVKIVNADLHGDGRPLWCGLSAIKMTDSVAVGFSPEGEELWHYALPEGPPQPIEPIVAGRLRTDGAGQWILPGPDGSIHVLSADGRLVDKFNYGTLLQGLATATIGGRPALIIATSNGLQAWKVE